MNIFLKNTLRVLYYGWKESGKITKTDNVKKSRMSVYFDMISCFRKYNTLASQYSEQKMYSLSGSEKENVGLELKKINVNRDLWEQTYHDNWKFLNKYTKLKWESTPKKGQRRSNAYIKHFNLGKNTWVQYGVMFICEHYSVGKLKVGKNVLFARGCDIDYTGDIEIGNNVGILEGAKILTHAHDSYHFMKDSDLIPFSNRAYKTNLKIGDNVSICAHAVILPGVSEIGENSIISAGAIVNRPVPANVIVAGNPAQVVRKIPATVKIRKHEQ